MGVVERFKQKLRQLEASINPAIKKTIDSNKSVLVDMNTNDQLFKDGEDAAGKELVPSYALSTKVSKRRKGQKTSNVTLKDTGNFYKSVNIDTTTTQAIFTANVEYYKYLVTHYSTPNILGLTRDNKKEFISKYIEPTIENNFKKIISK